MSGNKNKDIFLETKEPMENGVLTTYYTSCYAFASFLWTGLHNIYI